MSIEEFHWDVNVPFIEHENWSTLVTRYEDGKEQRRKKWSAPKHAYEITLRGRTNTISDQVWSFYYARSGAFDTFYFKNPNENPNTKVIGSGDSSNLNFNIPDYPLPSGAITLSTASFSYTETTHYTLTRSTGAVVFNQAPTGDLTCTYNFCHIVRFADDKLDRELFNYRLFNMGIKLIEVL